MSRHAFILLTTALACSPAAPAVTTPTPAPTAASPPPAATSETRETLAEDAPRTTASGNSFVAPAGWTLTQRENLTVLSPPEGGSAIVLVDVAEADDEAAVAAAWQAYKPDASWPLDVTTDVADHDGWTGIKRRGYRTSPNEKRVVVALSMHANGSTTVVIFDMARAIAEKRGAQVQTIFGRLFPKGHERESFAGKAANPLTPERIKALTDFVERSQADLGVPGVGLGIVEKGKVVFAGGFGVREIGKPAKIDADTRFIVASNTKAMTTLMLGKLVAEGKMTWETPAQELLPEFRLGDPDTTKQVRVKHLICACTGMPRQALEWFLNFEAFTPKGALAALGEMQPTSGFGELFQYSNPLAAATRWTLYTPLPVIGTCA